MEQHPGVDQDVVEKIAEAAAEKAVALLFEKLGIRYGDPYEMQRDFAFLREWRQTCEAVRGKGLLVMISVTITGITGLLIIGFRQWIQ